MSRIHKSGHWERADGSLWWHNPETNRVEPYSPSKDSNSERVPEPKPNKAEDTPKEVSKPLQTYAVKTMNGRLSSYGQAMNVPAAHWIGGDQEAFEAFQRPGVKSLEITSGVNGAHLVDFGDMAGIFKPLNQEDDFTNFRDTIDPAVSQTAREVVACKVDRLFGFNLVPPTTISVQEVAADKARQDKKHQVGSIQLCIQGEDNAFHDRHSGDKNLDKITKPIKKKLKQLVLLDIILGNTDRHDGNFMVDFKNNQVYAIDNGLTFPTTMQEKRQAAVLTKVTGISDHTRRDYNPTIRDAVGLDRDIRDQVLKVTPTQFMEAFKDAGFAKGEPKEAYKRLRRMQQVFQVANNMEDDPKLRKEVRTKVAELSTKLERYMWMDDDAFKNSVLDHAFHPYDPTV